MLLLKFIFIGKNEYHIIETQINGGLYVYIYRHMGIKTSIRCLLVAETFAIVLNNPDSIPLSAFYLFSYYFLSLDKGAKSDSIYIENTYNANSRYMGFGFPKRPNIIHS